MSDVRSRMLAAALRAAVAEVADDPEAAAHALAALLAPPAPPPAPVVQRDRKPAKPKKRPAPRVVEPEHPEGARLVAQLVERHGDLATVAERFGFNRELLRRWGRGLAASPTTLERLRAALASPAPEELAREGEAEAASPAA